MNANIKNAPIEKSKLISLIFSKKVCLNNLIFSKQ